MLAKAIYKFARVTPRKARRVIDLIRGKRAGEAMVSLKYMPYRAAGQVSKTLRSAMANAEQKKAVDPENLKIVEAYVNDGPVMKRLKATTMGRGVVIKKRTAHIVLCLSDEQ